MVEPVTQLHTKLALRDVGGLRVVQHHAGVDRLDLQVHDFAGVAEAHEPVRGGANPQRFIAQRFLAVADCGEPNVLLLDHPELAFDTREHLAEPFLHSVAAHGKAVAGPFRRVAGLAVF